MIDLSKYKKGTVVVLFGITCAPKRIIYCNRLKQWAFQNDGREIGDNNKDNQWNDITSTFLPPKHMVEKDIEVIGINKKEIK